jgi:hypothetical protein
MSISLSVCSGKVYLIDSPFIDFGDWRKKIVTNFKYFYGNKIHFLEAFGVMFFFVGKNVCDIPYIHHLQCIFGVLNV